MTPRIDLAGPLDDLAAALTGAGISASVDVGKVQVPGVLVQCTGISLDRLAGYTLDVTLLCIVADSDPSSTLVALSTLVNSVLTLVDPVDDLSPRTVAPAWSAGAVLPGIAVPIQLDCDFLPTEEPIP